MAGVTAPSTINRSERHQGLGLMLVIVGLMIGGLLSVLFVSHGQASPFIGAMLAFLSAAGVFFLFAYAFRLMHFGLAPATNDLTQAIADSSPDGLLISGAGGQIVYANEAYLALCQGPTQGAITPVERLFSGPPEVSEAIYRLAQAARQGRRAVEEIRLAHPVGATTGGVAWYRLRVQPIPRGKGHGEALWTVSDITRDRERQENVFQELQQAIDYLDHAPAGFMSIDASGSIAYMNATLASWLDHDLAQIGAGGLKLADVVAGDASPLITHLSGAPGDVVTDILDVDLKKRGGETVPVRVLHRVAFAHDGEPGASRTLVLDRGPKGAQDEAQRAAEVRFARLFNTTPFALAIVDVGGRILSANASFLRLFGGALRPEGGERRTISSIVTDAGRAAIDRAISAAAEGRGSATPIDATLAGKEARSARFFVTPVGGSAAGEGEAAIVYAIETTEQRALEAQFAQAQKMQAVGQLAGGVAHDFNNVLQAIIGYSDLLLANHRPTDPAFQDIIQIKQNANRAKNLVQHLLAFSRRQTLRPQVLQLGELIGDLSLLAKRLVGETVKLDMRQGRDLWDVHADATQFEQAILNLAVNARDAMPEGGDLAIRTRNVPAAECASFGSGLVPGDYVLVEIEDSGTGISPENIEKIFEPFFTTKEVGKGTGLGLSMVYGFVKQTGGFILCDSVVGRGTIFRIFLPRHVEERNAPLASTNEAALVPSVAETEAAAAALEAPAVDHTGTGCVLLVEDEEAVRKFAARALASRGYEVLEAASGREAIELLEESEASVDLVVSDVVMPEMDGPTLMRELRKRDPALKIIFVSGYAEDAFAKNLPEGERFTFLPKPFTLKQLIETVKTAIG